MGTSLCWTTPAITGTAKPPAPERAGPAVAGPSLPVRCFLDTNQPTAIRAANPKTIQIGFGPRRRWELRLSPNSGVSLEICSSNVGVPSGLSLSGMLVRVGTTYLVRGLQQFVYSTNLNNPAN